MKASSVVSFPGITGFTWNQPLRKFGKGGFIFPMLSFFASREGRLYTGQMYTRQCVLVSNIDGECSSFFLPLITPHKVWVERLESRSILRLVCGDFNWRRKNVPSHLFHFL